tara:strand:+ start:521 stop:658 length:138 start_codon:yes stop_codon:yes gene_type:complete
MVLPLGVVVLPLEVQEALMVLPLEVQLGVVVPLVLHLVEAFLVGA